MRGHTAGPAGSDLLGPGAGQAAVFRRIVQDNLLEVSRQARRVRQALGVLERDRSRLLVSRRESGYLGEVLLLNRLSPNERVGNLVRPLRVVVRVDAHVSIPLGRPSRPTAVLAPGLDLNVVNETAVGIGCVGKIVRTPPRLVDDELEPMRAWREVKNERKVMRADSGTKPKSEVTGQRRRQKRQRSHH